MQALATGPGALFVGDGGAGAGNGIDLAIKVREDPLFLIRQKEEEAKKKLASNPIKLKQLQQVIHLKILSNRDLCLVWGSTVLSTFLVV